MRVVALKGGLGGTTGLDGLLLGTYISAQPTLESVAIFQDVGGYNPWVFPADLSDSYPPSETVAMIVPEGPSLSLATALLLAAAFARSRPAQHDSR